MTASKPASRRRAPRLSVERPGRLKGRLPHAITVIDLSLTGCLVRCGDPARSRAPSSTSRSTLADGPAGGQGARRGRLRRRRRAHRGGPGLPGRPGVPGPAPARGRAPAPFPGRGEKAAPECGRVPSLRSPRATSARCWTRSPSTGARSCSGTTPTSRPRWPAASSAARSPASSFRTARAPSPTATTCWTAAARSWARCSPPPASAARASRRPLLDAVLADAQSQPSNDRVECQTLFSTAARGRRALRPRRLPEPACATTSCGRCDAPVEVARASMEAARRCAGRTSPPPPTSSTPATRAAWTPRST